MAVVSRVAEITTDKSSVSHPFIGAFRPTQRSDGHTPLLRTRTWRNYCISVKEEIDIIIIYSLEQQSWRKKNTLCVFNN